MSEICVYDLLASTFTGNGVAVLCPTRCKTKSIAGGAYTFEMEHPLDPWGKWKHLQEEAVVRLPVPRERIANAFSGQDADIYVTTTTAELREGMSEPTDISYPEWVYTNEYAVGSKVRCSGWTHKNWKCIYWDGTSQQVMVPPYNCSWWAAIPDRTTGSAVLATLPAGTELYLVATETGWYQMSTYYGLVGYVKASQVEFLEHRSAEDMQDRDITDQLFRIKSVTVNKKNNTVSVSGVHVAADLSGIQVKDITMTQASPAMAIGRVVDNLLWSYAGTIGTDLVGDSYGTFTGDFKGKNGTYCLLDPDSGIVPAFDAKFTRDNWDLFILARDTTWKGYEIRYAKNANGIDWKDDSEGLITRVMPYAKDAKGNNLYLPETYIDADNINDYPVVYMETLKVDGQVGKAKNDAESEVWTEADLLTEMRTKAAERFSVDLVNYPATTVTVQFNPLEATVEYSWLSQLTGVLPYDVVRVTDTEIDRSADLIVSELEYDCIKRKVVGLKLVSSLSGVSRSVTGYSITNASIGSEKLKDDVTETIVNAAVSKMPEFSDPSSGTVTVTDGDPTLAWDTRSTVGTVGGTDLHVTMPSQPATSVSDGNPTLAWGTQSTVGTVGGTDLHVKMPADPSVSVINNLASTSTTSALSANMGRALDEDKADKTDTVLNTTLSSGRKSDTTVGSHSIAYGSNVTASGDYSVAFGNYTVASGDYSHAEGGSAQASGKYSHAEGDGTEASGNYSHAENEYTDALGASSHAEGFGTEASGDYSHAEGRYARATGTGSHAEGSSTRATGDYSHAEGYMTKASGDYSHADGFLTDANSDYQHVIGYCNEADGNGTYLFIVGNGTEYQPNYFTPSNAHTLDWSGNGRYQGDVSALDCGGAQPISIVGLADGTAYRSTDGTAPTALIAGQYIWWKNALYKATTAIASGANLTSGNVSVVSAGGFNDLIANLGPKTWGTLANLWTWGELVGS